MCAFAQSCLNLCEPMDYGLPGSSVYGILQASILAAAAAAKSLQSCPTLCDPHRWQPTRLPHPWGGWLFHSPGDLPNPMIEPRSPALQADSLLFEPPGKPPVSICVCYLFSCVQLFMTPGTVVCQPPLSMGFSRQEYWSGLPFPSPGVSMWR